MPDTRHVAHHFDDAEQQFVAAELGMWVFLATEVLFFGGVFCGYAIYRFKYAAEFIAGSHRLDVWLGTVNTAVLLTSSLTMALAVHAAQTSRRGALVRNLLLTLLLGAAFLGVKGYEYHHKFEERLVPGRNFRFVAHSAHVPESLQPAKEEKVDPRQVELFFSLYFAMTGLHALHMIIGIGVLAVLIVAAGRGAFSGGYFTPIEMTGLYWHFVDIVWVFLFPLLYLIR
ncbi:MAG: cytochrome c oxidase subunit 3 family protein [Planctomycetes bacterium]|nr:cytochrome c oxidase subunit 3 family protein [Planctomycetota bacterium]